jgi:alkanesulfonate monooxygenase SsuD/methylene tetrahydromethanopterin reductase-like flavin-dependent oxidoreductase (luciferase family)
VDSLADAGLSLGLGCGWNRPEFLSHGYEFPALDSRIGMFRDSLRVIRNCLARQATSRSIPLIVGGASHSLVRVAAELADEWNWFGWQELNPVPAFQVVNEVVNGECSAVRNGLAPLTKSVLVTMEQAKYGTALVEAGAQHLILTLPPPYDPAAFMWLAKELGLG